MYSYQNYKRKRKPRLFVKDIDSLLYALGDNESYESSINCLDDILTEFLVDLTAKSLSVAKIQNRSRIKMDDLSVALKDDPLKLSRISYIRDLSQKVAMAKKEYDYNDYTDLIEKTKVKKEKPEKPKKKKNNEPDNDNEDDESDY